MQSLSVGGFVRVRKEELFFRLQVHERGGISLVEINGRVGKSISQVC